MHFLHRIAFVFLGVIGTLATLGYYLAPQDEIVPVDAIVAISGGDNSQRTRSAVELYKSGYANKIIFSGAARDPSGPSNAEAMKREAVEAGVVESDIILDEVARDTRENASRVAAIARSKDIDSIILVTSPYHQRRAYNEFRWAMGDDVTILNYSAKDNTWRRSQWWITSDGWYLTLSESLKLAVTYAQHMIGN